MSPFLPVGRRGLHGAPSAAPFVPASPQIYSWPRQCHAGPDRNKLIHTSAHPVGAHMTHLKQTIKGHFRLFKILRKGRFPWRWDGRPVAAH